MARLAARFDQHPPFQHHILTDLEGALAEHRPHAQGQPILKPGASVGVGDQFNAKTDFGEGPREYWCPVATGSQPHVTHGHGFPPWLKIDVAFWRRLQRVYHRCAGLIPLQASKFVNRYDHHFVLAVQGDVLRTMAAHTPDKLTEPGFRILQRPPITRAGGRGFSAGTLRRVGSTSHSD